MEMNFDWIINGSLKDDLFDILTESFIKNVNVLQREEVKQALTKAFEFAKLSDQYTAMSSGKDWVEAYMLMLGFCYGIAYHEHLLRERGGDEDEYEL